jgi:prepilin signal peptidase PulO-like enzyme (type II secretory pathway)
MSVPVLLLFLAFALPASWIDFRTCRIPDLLIFPCFAVILSVVLIVETGSLPNRLAAALLSFLFFFIIRRVFGGLGLGDVKFAALIGLCCGLPWVCIAFLSASLTGMLGILFSGRGRTTGRRPIPFAPFLTLGVITAYVLSLFIDF